MRVIITGGTGLIGRRLAAQLVAEKHEVVILTRNPQKAGTLPQGVRTDAWDGQSAAGWGALVNGDSAIVNLTGQPIVSFPFSEAHKAKVLESRLAAGRAVRQAIEAAGEKPRVLIQSSAIGIYGDRKDEVLTEDAHPEDGWFGSVVSAWEDAADGAPTRIVKIRTGIVLDKNGGALAPLVLSGNFFGGALGSGKQWMSWIHNDDECAAIRHLIANEKAEGVYNLVAPNPVTNKDFVKTLAKVLGRIALVPAPELALRVVLGDLAATLLDSQRGSAQKLLDTGFAFQYPTLEPALRNLLGK